MNTENKQSDGVGYPPGTRIGKYDIVERLGIGGQAIVYKAHDPLLDRDVAIKQISTHLAENPEFLERFRKEAQILARLASSQPALVTIHELIQEERGLFIVLEFVPGHTLETTLSQNPGPVEAKAVLQILWRLAGGLHAVHAAGIIHRDIKPGNIIIGDGLKVKITDFGVAASSGETSMVLGTTKYMAPELYGQKSVDARADMYSLGFIAYEMLLGRAKFNEVFSDVVRDKHSEALRWMKWHGNEQVAAPPLNEVNPAIPKALADIVAMMMSKNPELRYPNMEQLGRAIKSSFSPRAQAVREGFEAQSRAPKPAAPSLEEEGELEIADTTPPPPTAPLPKRRLKTFLVAGGVTALVLVVGLGILLGYWQFSKKKVQQSAEIAMAEAQKALNEGKFAKAEDSLKTIQQLFSDGGPAMTAAMTEAMNAFKKDQRDQAMLQFDTVVRLHAGETAVGPIMAEAEKAYKEGQYKRASWQFELLSKLYPATQAGMKCLALVHLAKARQATEEAASAKADAARQPFWTIAAAEADAAKKAREDVQRGGAKLDQWYLAFDKELDDFGKTRVNARLFWSAMDKAIIALEAQKFDDARTVLAAELTTLSIPKTAKQSELLAQLRNRIDLGDFEVQFGEHMTKGLEAIKTRKFEIAVAELNQAAKLLKDPIAEKLTPEARKHHVEEVTKAWGELSKFNVYGTSMKNAEELLQDDKKAEAIVELEKAYKVFASPELDARIKGLKAELLIKEGRDLAKDGHFKEARVKFEESLTFRQTQEAKDEIDKIDRSEKYRTIMGEANRAFNNGDFAKAVEKFQQALEIDPADEDVKAKLRTCKYSLKFAEAKSLGEKKEYDKAQKLLAELNQDYPDKAQEISSVADDLRQNRDYEQALAIGNENIKARQWNKAREAFTSARKIKDLPEVQDLINLAFYRENVEKGQTEMDRGDFASALAFFKMAARYKKSAEIDALILAAEKKLAAQKGGGK